MKKFFNILWKVVISSIALVMTGICMDDVGASIDFDELMPMVMFGIAGITGIVSAIADAADKKGD